MVNLQVSSLSLSFGDRVILSDVSFSLSEKSRIALMGANGSGKSTLLKAISHNIEAESMNISLTKGARVSYLPQSDIVPEGSSVYDAAEHGYDRFLPKVKELERLEKADASMKTAEGIATLHEELEEGGYYSRKRKIEQVLLGLGFEMKDMSRPVEDFSGGYQMRVALAKVLLEESDFLLLDEPTNYLDIDALTYLEGFIKSFHGGLVLVSHDQDFID
ncbi:MAG TPA: ABC-F family ATP-binding cassette domain-containing protein, partial [Candidatus Ornithospirochaeta stercorigallinarum]|nr:ABC-F family ATP-binding cassette domain-containing protein [Candidatus Ornithospirochaeta stercorigallinarum]